MRARVRINLERAKVAPVVVDGRFPVPAAACASSVYIRPDATEAQRRRAVATWLLASTGDPFTTEDVASVEMLL